MSYSEAAGRRPGFADASWSRARARACVAGAQPAQPAQARGRAARGLVWARARVGALCTSSAHPWRQSEIILGTSTHRSRFGSHHQASEGVRARCALLLPSRRRAPTLPRLVFRNDAPAHSLVQPESWSTSDQVRSTPKTVFKHCVFLTHVLALVANFAALQWNTCWQTDIAYAQVSSCVDRAGLQTCRVV